MFYNVHTCFQPSRCLIVVTSKKNLPALKQTCLNLFVEYACCLVHLLELYFTPVETSHKHFCMNGFVISLTE